MDLRKYPGLLILGLTWMLLGVALAQQGPGGDLAPPGPGGNLPQGPSGNQAPLPTAPGILQLSVGDQVKMDVFDRPEMSGVMLVDEDGSIRVPLAGAVEVSGLSPVVAAQKVEAALKSGQYLVNPHVTLTVVQSLGQRAAVYGEVKTPGRYAIDSTTTILDVLALAGGRTDKASAIVYLLREDTPGTVSRSEVNLGALADPKQSVPDSLLLMKLRGGDRIYVPPAGEFFISGEVRNPNRYRFENGMTVLQAITDAGGVTEKGSTHRIEVKRRGPKGDYVVISVRLTDQIQADDVITVKERIF
jgi:polysaccharide export outer membrane protein